MQTNKEEEDEGWIGGGWDVIMADKKNNINTDITDEDELR